MGRSPLSSSSGDESGLKKGPWTPEEDDKLINYIQKHGHGSWRALPKLAGLNRCGKSCRLRWTNYLRPDIKRGKFSQEEEQTILNLHSILGNKWSAIATHLPGRTDNEIKNFWNTHLKKKLIQMGFDPMTHRPRTDIFSSLPHLIALANLIENPCWEDQAMRLQAEALQMARLNHCLQNLLQPTTTTFPPATTFHNVNNSQPLDHLMAAANFNLFNSLKDTSSILSHLETAAPAQVDFLQETMGFTHMPDLRAPCSGVNDQTTACFGKGQVSDFDGLVSNEPVTESSMTTNTVDGSSSSSYGGTQMWSQLLDDPIFNDIV